MQRIRIRRIEECQRTVLYAFRPEGLGEGVLLLDKAAGKIVEVQPVDHPRAPRFFRRAGRKVYQHWQRGEYPAETWWGAPRLTVPRPLVAQAAFDEKQSV
jgi:hypothetical protein